MSYPTEKRCDAIRIVLWIVLMAGLLAPVSTLKQANAATVPVPPPYWIKDIDNGTQSSGWTHDHTFHIVGTRAYFCAHESPVSYKIWMTDLSGLTQRAPIPAANIFDCPQFVGILGDSVIVKLQTSGPQYTTEYELWRTNGTTAGTAKLYSTSESNFYYYDLKTALLNGVLYMGNGWGLWRSDGTPQGTYLISSSLSIATMVTFNGALYFTKTDGYNYWELWRSNGTAAGTQMIKHVPGSAQVNTTSPADHRPNPGLPPNFGMSMLVNHGKLFIADGNNFWISDGTDAGTVIAAQAITYDVSGRPPLRMVPYKTQVSFVQWDVANMRNQVWLSDGTLAGTHAASSVLSQTYSISAVGNWLYVTNGNNQLWRTDGTDAGTQLIGAFPNPPNYSSAIWLVGEWQNKLLFQAHPSPNSPQQLMVTDGTPSGTRVLLNLPLDSQGYGIVANTFTDFNGKLLFWDTHASTGEEPYLSDGTDAGTHLVRDINVLPSGNQDIKFFTTLGQQTYFLANDAAHGRGLWVTQGAPNDGVFLHALPPMDISGTIYDQVRIGRPTPLNNLLLYVAPTLGVSSHLSGSVAFVLWRTDGTPEGTFIISEKAFEVSWSINADPTPLGVAFGPYRYFFLGQELWRTDGTRTGTTLVKPFNSVIKDNRLFSWNGALYFVESNSNNSILWRSDGTEAGTVIVGTINSAYERATYERATTNRAIFFSNDSSLWASDGTPTGTVQLHTATVTPTAIVSLKPIGDLLYFVANDGVHGKELWRSDGTIGGTAIVSDITPGITGTFPESSHPYLFQVGSKIVFAPATEPPAKHALWISDGTTTGTQKLIELDGSLAPLGALGSKVIFSQAAESPAKSALWVSDGTEIGTLKLVDLEDTTFGLLQTSNSGRHLFYGNTSYSGLWQTDGTVTGTYRITDTVDSMTLSGDTLLFLREPGINPWPARNSQLWWKDADATQPTYLLDLPSFDYDHLTILNNHLFFVGTDNNLTGRLMAWPIPQPTNTGVDVSLQAPTLVPINEAGNLNLPIRLMNSGQTNAQPVTLTLELGDGMTYTSDTSGHNPQVQGNQLRWQWNEMPFLSDTHFSILLQAPRGNLGARSPFTLTVQSAQPDGDASDNLVHAQTWTAVSRFMPIVQR